MNDGKLKMSEVSANAAHALNNVLNMLYAASLYLEEAPEDKNVERARIAVKDVYGSAQGLSAAFSLFALGEADLEAAEPLAQSHDLDDFDVEHLSETLVAVAKVDVELPPPGSYPLRSSVGRDVLESVLACAAVMLRRTAAPGAGLRCEIRSSLLPGGGAGGGISISISTHGDAAAASARSAHHPCADALDYAMPFLERLGFCVTMAPGKIEVAVRAPAGKI